MPWRQASRNLNRTQPRFLQIERWCRSRRREIELLEGEYEAIENMLPLSPLQEGLVLPRCSMPKGGTYTRRNASFCSTVC